MMKSNFGALLNGIEPRPFDTVGDDGLIYCGKCGEPRQFIPSGVDGLSVGPLRRACLCEREEQDREVKKAQFVEFAAKMNKLRAEYGIPLPYTSRASFAADDSPSSKVSKAARRYVEYWDEMRAEGAGLLFCGSVGTGKSFYAEAIVNALLEKRIPAEITSFPRLLNILQGAKDRQRVIDSLSAYKLLVLDDLGVERDSAYAVEQVYNVIDSRARSKLPLIVTTNLPLEVLQKPEPVQCARIYDRVFEMCPFRVPMIGQSRRSGKTQKRKELESLLFADD